VSRIGVRPIPIDGLPLLGPSAIVENFHFAVTHSGVTLCLRVAELVGASVRGELVDELAPFRHARPDGPQPPAMSADHEPRQSHDHHRQVVADLAGADLVGVFAEQTGEQAAEVAVEESVGISPNTD
jgi:glycine/D-amino acid oxidase-like deaminating enzyme